MVPHNGDKVKDRVTGYEGIVIGVTHWLNGCIRIGIQGVGKMDELPKDAFWADSNQVEVLEAGVIKPGRLYTDEPPGGPALDPRKPMDPKKPFQV